MLFNFIKFDLYNGILRKRRKMAAIFLLFVVINFTYAALIHAFIQNGLIPNASSINTGDYIMYYLSGISMENTSHSIPFLWIFQMLGCCFSCLHYPLEDLRTSGKHRLILCGNRTIWWISKCLWLSANVIVYYALAYAASLFTSVLSGANANCSITGYTVYLLKLTGPLNKAPYNGTGYFLFIPFVAIAICMLQMTLSLLIQPLYSFVFIAGYLLISVYFKTPYLIGDFAMLARSNLIDAEGFSAITGGTIAGIFIVLSVVFGIVIFRNKDIF